MKQNITIEKKKCLYHRLKINILLIAVTFVISQDGVGQVVAKYLQNEEHANLDYITVTVDFDNTSMDQAILEVGQKAGVTFNYNAELLSEEAEITYIAEKTPVSEVLKAILPQTISFLTVRNIVILQKEEAREHLEDFFQEMVTGAVTDSETGEVLPGVTVLLKNTNTGTSTGSDGNFELAVPSLNDTLIFSSIGYQAEEVVIAGQTEIHVTLHPDVIAGEELVVVGYGSQDKTTVTGAISTVRSRELLHSPQANVSNALVGRMPGLLAVQRSGQPGEDAAQLRIRGIGTFSGSQNPLVMVDGIETTNYNNIDPNEVESITILKDASATAVYGVRGANGVLIITTKRGVTGRPQISFTSNYALTQFTDLRQSARAYDYVTSFNQARAYDSYVTGSYDVKFSNDMVERYDPAVLAQNPEMADPILYPDVDWFDVMFKPISAQGQYNMTVSGGTERVKYFVSAGYFDQEGLFNDDIAQAMEVYNAQPRFQRYNFRSNLDFDITERFTANINISSQIEQRTGNTAGLNRTIEVVTKSNPINTPGIVDGMLIAPDITGPGSQNGPDQLLRANYQRHYRNYLNGSVRLNYDLSTLVQGLFAHGTVSYQTYNTQNQDFGNAMIRYQRRVTSDGQLIYVPLDVESPISFNESVQKNRREYLEFGINYERTLANNHQVGGLVLYNQSKLHDPSLAYLIPSGYQGLVGRVTYAYRERYLAEFNIGYNGTENFAEGHRFGLFPAYSLGWVISEESFFPESDFLSFLKVRGSMGEVGNDQVGGARFLYMPTAYIYHGNWSYNFGDINNRNQYNAVVEDIPGNPNLTWERAKKRNIGIEATFWRDRIRIEADVFEETRDNILASLGTVPTIVGGAIEPYNLGEMRNRGFEADISFYDGVGEFTYWIRANYTFARNTVLFSDEVERPYEYLRRTGQAHGQIFGLIANGFYNTWDEVNGANRPVSAWNGDRLQPGDIRYKDVNGDGIIDEDDIVPIGYPTFPEKLFGFSVGGNFRGFDVSILFQGAANVSVNYSRHARYGFREDAGVAQYLVDYSWTEERYEQGLPIDFPRLSEGDQIGQHNYVGSTFWVRDASYLRLKNAEIGYSLSSAFMERWGLTRVRIFANGNNLITWSNMLEGIDPETHIASTNSEPYPATRTVNFGLNIQF